ncbi:c-type cytochrome biogenesis protein CcmI [Thiohalocapsa marina]|uniref:c-type cytochrome biogenesis protein CcmI n=1 Tax=Thiohalocapsa marina TaxID=424902 RepID=UPI0036DBE0D5
MTIFWILAAGLTGLAVLFVVAPLLQSTDNDAGTDDDVDLAQVNLALFKQQLAELDGDLASGKLDQSQYDAARHDLEREALQNLSPATDAQDAAAQDSAAQGTAARPGASRLPGPRITALVLLVAVPLSAFSVYLAVGNQQIIPQIEAAARAGGPGQGEGHAGGAGMPSLEVLVARLEERMQQTPDDAEGWVMLGRTYFSTGDTAKAEGALARAYALLPTDIQVILTYAEAVAANNGNDLQGRPAELIAEALALAPDDPTAQWLSGMVAFQRGQYNAAARTWTKALAPLEPQSEDAAELRQLIAAAEERAGVPPQMRTGATDDSVADAEVATGTTAEASTAAPVEAPVAAQATTTPAAAGLTVNVSLAPELRQGLDPRTTVFVYAKAAAGPPMPLAAQRITVADLPATLRLDDSMAMTPAMTMSLFPQVVVGARVSPSGQATPQPGDLEGDVGPVANTSTDTVLVRIDRIRP